MISIEVVLVCLWCLLLLIAIRIYFGYRISVRTTHLIHAYNLLCWLQNEYERCLNYDDAEKPIWYQMLCPWVVTVRQCLTKDAWEKVKSIKSKEKEIIAAADEKYNKICEEIEEIEKRRGMENVF
jgi:hypothetical protein